MSLFAPSCLDDFLISNLTERDLLELILSRKLPFPFNGKSGILLHGTYGTGKSTLGFLLPSLLETAYAGNYPQTSPIGQMQATEEGGPEVFRCGGGLSSTAIVKHITMCNSRNPIHHYGQTDYFLFDEVDKLTLSAQQSLKSVMDLKRCQFIFTTNYLDRIDDGIIDRSYLIEMNKASNANAYVAMGQSILQKIALAPTAMPVTAITTIAHKAKGSLRRFANEMMIEGIKLGGVIPK
jgi:replication-associated recombination protein RarA